MKKLFLFLLVLITVEASAQIYFYGEKAEFYDGNGNYVSSQSLNTVAVLTDEKLVIGNLTFYFYGNTTSSGNTTTSMATPDDGSGNCKVSITIKTKTKATIKLKWSNITSVLYMRY
jgi:hypothetical protein